MEGSTHLDLAIRLAHVNASPVPQSPKSRARAYGIPSSLDSLSFYCEWLTTCLHSLLSPIHCLVLFFSLQVKCRLHMVDYTPRLNYICRSNRPPAFECPSVSAVMDLFLCFCLFKRTRRPCFLEDLDTIRGIWSSHTDTSSTSQFLLIG
jgi:hypothetical protein